MQPIACRSTSTEVAVGDRRHRIDRLHVWRFWKETTNVSHRKRQPWELRSFTGYCNTHRDTAIPKRAAKSCVAPPRASGPVIRRLAVGLHARGPVAS